MNPYSVAVIIAGIDESYQSAILKGIENSAANYSININVFVSSTGILDNPKHDSGEFNIFNLPDFSDFDGAVLLTNTIPYQPLVNSILDRVRKAGIPAVSIDNDIPGFYHIGINNKIAMREVTEHFIQKHGFTRFNYISGPKDNPESIDRLNGFLDVLRENNISIEDERIYYGDFRAQSGQNAVSAFLKSDLEMPQVVICANDAMAVSAMIALSAEGFSIPDDICVSGFDNAYSANNYPIQLSTVDRPLTYSGGLACRILYNHFNNIPQQRSIILDMRPCFTESCGCDDVALKSKDEFKVLNYKNFTKYERTLHFTTFFNKMSCKLNECYSLDDFIEAMKPLVLDLAPEEFYLALCTDWDSSSDAADPSVPDSSPHYTSVGYTEYVSLPIAFCGGEFLKLPNIRSKDIIPKISASDRAGKNYYLIPLHFGDRCLGYAVILNCSVPLDNSMFHTWCICISNAIENLRKINSLDYAVKRLNNLYTLDTFSGIFNRNGFIQATSDQYNYCIRKGLPIMLMFIDLDGLKKINDTYGHSVGDNAIHSIADVMKLSCTNGEVFCRFGGDEFIIFGADYSEDMAKTLAGKIDLNIEKINDSGVNPFTLSASLGYYITTPQQGADIFEFVTIADNIMYHEKRKKKLSKYLKS